MLLNEDEKLRHQAITGAVMYLAQSIRYDILYAVNQLARALSKLAKAYMGAAKHLFRYLAWSTDFSITYKYALEPGSLCLQFTFSHCKTALSSGMYAS